MENNKRLAYVKDNSEHKITNYISEKTLNDINDITKQFQENKQKIIKENCDTIKYELMRVIENELPRALRKKHTSWIKSYSFVLKEAHGVYLAQQFLDVECNHMRRSINDNLYTLTKRIIWVDMNQVSKDENIFDLTLTVN